MEESLGVYEALDHADSGLRPRIEKALRKIHQARYKPHLQQVGMGWKAWGEKHGGRFIETQVMKTPLFALEELARISWAEYQ